MAQTNVQAFSGDVDISSNLEVGTANLIVDTVNSRVGIGTTNPDGPLHIFKSAPSNGDTGPGILFTRYLNTYGGCIWNESNNDLDGLYFKAFQNSQVSNHYGGAPDMVINSNGNVGIGVTDPGCTLDINYSTSQFNGIFSNRLWVASVGDNSGDGSPDDNTGSPWYGLGYDNLA